MYRETKMRSVGLAIALLLLAGPALRAADDLAGVKARGTLRHLAIPYANFNTGAGDGLEVEMMKLFAAELGVKYEYIDTSWKQIIGDLTGKTVKPQGQKVEILGETPIRGDVIANGFTVLPWREQIVAFSTPTFPTQVWLVTKSDSPLAPIVPSGRLEDDIAAVKKLLAGRTVLGMPGTCLDPELYDLAKIGAAPKNFTGGLNDLAPALLQDEAESVLLDVPDCLVALRKWPGKFKVIGPLSEVQTMATAFAPGATELHAAYERFLAKCKQNGTYARLVQHYYPDVFSYFPEFFRDCAPAAGEPARK